MDSQNDAAIVKLYYEYGKSPNAVRKVLRKQYPDIQPLSRKQIYRIIKKFEETGSVFDRRKGNSGRRKTGRSEDIIEEVKEVIEETPKMSVRTVMSNITNKASVSTVRRILKFDLKLKPYKVQVMQHLKETDTISRMEFSNWALLNPAAIDATWFTDESHFHLNVEVNKQNLRVWSSSKPDFYEERPLHSPKVTVWAAMSSQGIIGPYFYEVGGETATVTTDRYLTILKKNFIPELQKRGHTLHNVWFQQDGAAPHTANAALDWLSDTFAPNLISLKTAIEWPPHSPDLNPLDFFMWGYLKERVYTPPPTSISQLKTAIRREMRMINTETCKATIRNFQDRIRLVLQKRGGHIEHVM